MKTWGKSGVEIIGPKEYNMPRWRKASADSKT
nr:MAG TPA: hypothetical protein [Caudoviricetes sp.]